MELQGTKFLKGDRLLHHSGEISTNSDQEPGPIFRDYKQQIDN